MITIDLKGKRALVTGASSGIGEAIALALAQAGADVAVNYLEEPSGKDAADAERVAAAARQYGVRAVCLAADISDAGQVERMFAALDGQLGGVDILVNNAGIDGPHARCWESNPNDWYRVIQINLFGAYHCAREALKRMTAARRGVIINISSVHERIPWSGYSAYTCSKAALAMLTQTLAQETADLGVRVVAVAPGAIKTHINQAVWGNPDTLKDLLRKIPANRMGEPDEIGRMVALLASDMASYVTGPSVIVDGGMVLYPSFRHGG
ncbi:MAG: glucose 1-dehydrogenase [Gammaproteobacteria bacterium]|nr:glucose 1-dehydrogenase [Gammaproteobacteria bacterium]